jgi:hypothetical protein
MDITAVFGTVILGSSPGGRTVWSTAENYAPGARQQLGVRQGSKAAACREHRSEAQGRNDSEVGVGLLMSKTN